MYNAPMPINKARILYEDDALLIVDKLSGELVVRGKGRLDKLPLLDFLEQEYPGLRPIHRLDFETSGAVAFAKRKDVLEAVLAKKFAGWVKTYVALVLDPLEKDSGVIDIPLPARSGEGKVKAQTRFRVLERFKGITYVEAQIERGQFHQIRRHFAAIKHPLILDDIYGNKKLNKAFSKEFRFRRFFLHAKSLLFPHPITGKIVEVDAPLPKPFAQVLEEMKKRK